MPKFGKNTGFTLGKKKKTTTKKKKNGSANDPHLPKKKGSGKDPHKY